MTRPRQVLAGRERSTALQCQNLKPCPVYLLFPLPPILITATSEEVEGKLEAREEFQQHQPMPIEERRLSLVYLVAVYRVVICHP